MTRFYHGTIKNRAIAIAKEGILPSSPTPRQEPLTFLTPDIELAKDWGTHVIEIDLPSGFPLFLKGKERGFSEYYTKEAIPVHFIRNIQTVCGCMTMSEKFLLVEGLQKVIDEVNEAPTCEER